MRPSPAQAKAKVNEYIAFLEGNGVPTALFKERVKDIVDWGESVRFRKPNPAAPKSPEMKGIQSALDEMCRSEKYVREQRRGKYPHYPYASEEQKTLAETLSGIDMSQQAKESILKALHGDGGKAPLLREDLLQSKLLSMKAMDECSKSLPRHVHRFASCPQEGCFVPSWLRAACRGTPSGWSSSPQTVRRRTWTSSGAMRS